MAANLSATLSLKDANFTQGIRKACSDAKSQLSNLQGTFKGLDSVLGSINPNLQSAIGTMQGLVGAARNLVNPYTAAATAVAGLGVAWVNYNQTLEEETNITKKFLGITGDELLATRNAIKSISDTYSQDYTTSLGMVDQLTKQFGISAKEATDMIAVGMAGGANAADNMAGMINQYSGAFSDAGISAQEFIGVMAQTESGLFNEQGMSMITKAGAKIREMSKATADSLDAIGISSDAMTKALSDGSMTSMEAIKKISEKLRTLSPDTQEYAQVVKNVFGKVGVQAGSKMIEMLADMDVSIESVIQNMTAEQRATYELQQANKELQDAMASLFGVSEGGFSTMYTTLKTQVITAITTTINKFIDLYNKSMLIRGAIAALQVTFKTVWAVIKAVCKQFLISLEGIADVFEGIVTMDFGKVGAGVAKFIKGTGENLTNLGKEWGDAVVDAFNTTTKGEIKKIKVDADTTPAEETYTDDSLTALETKLSNLKKRYKDGLLKILPDDYKKQVASLENEIKRKKKELGIKFTEGGTGRTGSSSKTTTATKPTYADDSLTALETKLSNLKKQYKDGLLKILPDDYKKQVASLEDEIERKQIELGIKLVPVDGSVSQLEAQLSKLQDQYTKGLIQIDPESYKQLVESLEEVISDKRIKMGIDPDPKDDLDKRLNEIITESSKKTSFEVAVNAAPNNPEQDKGDLGYIESQMNANDKLIDDLSKLKQAYIDAGLAGSDSYQTILSDIRELTAANTELGEAATEATTRQNAIKKTQKNISKLGNALNSASSAFTALGSSFENPTLNVMGIVGQALATVALSFAESLRTCKTWYEWLAFGVSGAATMISMIGQIKSATSGYESGGIIPGSATHGDSMLVRANAQEMILTQQQQTRLWRFINSSGDRMYPTESGQVEFVIHGSKLVGVQQNYYKKHNRL